MKNKQNKLKEICKDMQICIFFHKCNFRKRNKIYAAKRKSSSSVPWG
jgi:hypothetical protein